MESLREFLIEAKMQTYANENIEKQISSRRGSNDYEYRSNNMIYHDAYFGGTNFMGEEVVYAENDTPIWGMNYYGVTLDETLNEEAVDKALRPALMQVGRDDIIPVSVSGNLDYFEGEESIYKNDKKIYSLKCHGGKIQK